jgi:metal-responsive CopG/Arc/MetJ family transcriptional regulator
VKTAISLSDELFVRVDHHAQRLGISRSEFFAKAAARYADELDGSGLTDAINRALGEADEDTEFVTAAARALGADDA